MFISSVFLTMGIIIVFLIVGILFSVSSLFIGEFLLSNYATFAKIQATLLIIAGSLMIRTPNFITKITLPSRIDRFTQTIFERENPYLSSFTLGSLYTLIALPCASGIFVLIWSEMLGDPFISQLQTILFFALGSGIPFFFLSVYIPNFNSHLMNSVNDARNKIIISLGVILIITGIWLLLSETPNNYIKL